EWAGNLACMAEAVKAGARLEVIPCDETGAVSVSSLEQLIDARVRLIALTWLPANGGLINPAAAIGEVARRHGIAYFIDAGPLMASDENPLAGAPGPQRREGHAPGRGTTAGERDAVGVGVEQLRRSLSGLLFQARAMDAGLH
ncbi:aminotransferase class V-fold PLP-dependent enzyme, partial [Pseudomonas gingeri]|uniref:aminotransferase class V-fold PLP-dependent enzyme n=1 Tax=Pseudomonas gingeri TaxID=117681 RepID=UPI00210CBEA5